VSGRGSSAVLRVVTALWLLLSVPAAGAVFFVSVFALSPTDCPDSGGSYLCRSSAAGSATLVALVLALLGVVVVALLATVDAARHQPRRALSLFGTSVAVLVATVVLVALAASTWT